MTTTSQRSGPSTAVLITAVITSGLTAGVFVEWSSTIMPGLARVDDRTFVLAFRSLDAAITNPLFLGVEFSGALVFTAAATALHLRPQRRHVLVWVALALLAYLAAIVITFAVNEPLNTRLRAAAATDGTDFTALRAELNASRWMAWNTVRAVTSTVAFGCLCVALGIDRRRTISTRVPRSIGIRARV